MIDRLTPEQEAKLSEYRDKWLRIGLQAGVPLPSKEVLLEVFTDIYKEGGLPAPKEIVTLRSPLEGATYAHEIEGGKGGITDTLWKAIYGTHDASWLSYYDYIGTELGIEACERLRPLMRLAMLGVGWCWTFSDTVIVTEGPKYIHMQRGVLHCATGPAIEYADGTRVYSLGGIRFSGDMVRYVTTPAEELDIGDVLSIRNVEQRSEVIKKIGVVRYLEKLAPRSIEKSIDGIYELLGVTIGPSYPERIYLRMLNPSVPGEVHLEAVHPNCRTVSQALAWRNFGKVEVPYTPPLELT